MDKAAFQFKLRGFAGLICAVVLILTTSPVAAEVTPEPLSEYDVYSIFNNSVNYDPTETEAAEGCVPSDVTLVGSENGEKIYNFLIQKGLSPIQAAGLMGNLYAESGLNPRRVQNTPTPSGDRDVMVIGTSVGYGLAQWTSKGRQEGLHAAAVAAGKQDSDLGVQLNWLWTELSGPYKNSSLDPLLKSTDIQEATSIIMIKFESPKDQSQKAQQHRAIFSRELLAKYGSASAATASSDSTTSSCGISEEGNLVEGSFSLPVPQKFYVSNQNWFTKPHHDYPASDIPVPTGTPVYSMNAGKIIKAPVGGSCGTGVLIDAGENTLFLYCHGSDGGSINGARNGDTVKPGQLIMHSASTGRSTGPHLHLQIKRKGNFLCPQKLFVGIVNKSIPTLDSLPTSGCTY